MILNVDFVPNLNKYTSVKHSLCLKWNLTFFPQYYIHGLTTINHGSPPLSKLVGCHVCMINFHTIKYWKMVNCILTRDSERNLNHQTSRTPWICLTNFVAENMSGQLHTMYTRHADYYPCIGLDHAIWNELSFDPVKYQFVLTWSSIVLKIFVITRFLFVLDSCKPTRRTFVFK